MARAAVRRASPALYLLLITARFACALRWALRVVGAATVALVVVYSALLCLWGLCHVYIVGAATGFRR